MRIIKPRKLHLNKPISHEATNIVKKNYNYYDKKNTNKEISPKIIILLVIIVTLASSIIGIYTSINVLGKNTSINDGIIKSKATIKEPNSIANAVEKVYDAVVVIEVYDEKENLVSTGTGFIYKKKDNKAYLMTNNHVITNGKIIKVLFTDKTEETAQIVGSDIYSDIAVLSINDSKKIVLAEMGDSQKLKPGDTVFTVGTPEGADYAGTVTKGILSAKERLVAVALENTASLDYYMEVLQTDAAINPGNSGGPLCNINGEVIGITNMKLVDDTVEGMGFAIPIEEALNVAAILEKDGKINRPKLGISISPVENKLDLYYKEGILVSNDIEYGLVVISVEANSAAAKAGLKKGDIIINLAGTKTTNLAEFRYELYKHNPREEIDITYIREDKKNTVKIVLSE